MRLFQYLKEENEMKKITSGVTGMYVEDSYTYIPKDIRKLKTVHTQQVKHEFVKKTGWGNVYKKKWAGYFLDPSKNAQNSVWNKPYNVEIIFNTKKDMDKFLEMVKGE